LIESAHRSVVQERLKVAGAWWKREGGEKMIALRIRRANKERRIIPAKRRLPAPSSEARLSFGRCPAWLPFGDSRRLEPGSGSRR